MRTAYDHSGKLPESFSQIFAAYSIMDADNAMVARLNPDLKAQVKLVRALDKMGQKKFINLVNNPDMARIALSLYSGDGIVTKITPDAFINKQGNLPYVLFPFKGVTLKDELDMPDIVIENHPYIRTGHLTQDDVETMREQLAKLGMKFRDRDGKPDNLGTLRDGTLAILDGDAVFVMDNSPAMKQKRKEAIKAWEQKIHALYPVIYASGFEHRQSEQTDYKVAPREPHHRHDGTGADVQKKAAHASWWQRVGRGGKGQGMSPQ